MKHKLKNGDIVILINGYKGIGYNHPSLGSIFVFPEGYISLSHYNESLINTVSEEYSVKLVFPIYTRADKILSRYLFSTGTRLRSSFQILKVLQLKAYQKPSTFINFLEYV